jgi:hypothetical protein
MGSEYGSRIGLETGHGRRSESRRGGGIFVASPCPAAPMGGIGSIEFRKVNEAGIDLYAVTFERGAAEAGIGVESDGRIGAAWIERR